LITAEPLTCEKNKLRQPECWAVPLTDLLGMNKGYLDPNRKNPQHRKAAQRGKANTGKLITPDSKLPETANYNRLNQESS